jgi:hypothetical protein
LSWAVTIFPPPLLNFNPCPPILGLSTAQVMVFSLFSIFHLVTFLTKALSYGSKILHAMSYQKNKIAPERLPKQSGTCISCEKLPSDTKLARAACVRCHGTKCPLLTSLLPSSAKPQFSSTWLRLGLILIYPASARPAGRQD